MEKRILIVGAGISGLSAGCYARFNGFRTEIFEMHSLPGGLCTAWERKGYKFDISMHMLTGSVSGPYHRMWKELGIIDHFDFYNHDHIAVVEGMGEKLILSADRKKIEEALLAISPEDGPLIREFTALLFGRDMMNAASLKPKKMEGLGDWIRMYWYILPMIRTFGKFGKLTLQEYAGRFRNPFLKEAVRFIVDAPGWPMPGFPMVAFSGFMRTGVTEAGAPLGGSQQVMFHMANLFRGMEGELHLKSRVRNLLIDGNRVKGIELEDGTQHRADHVIWAGDGHTLIYDILGGKYLDDRIRNRYEHWAVVKPIVHVMMGVDRDMSGEPQRLVFEPSEPIEIAGREYKWLYMIHHCFDPSMAPEHKSAVEVWYDTEYDYWEELYRDREAYKAEKKRIAEYTIRQLDLRFPGFASQVELADVPTPVTYHRYTGNWKGSPDGWYIDPGNMMESDPVRQLPGLEGLQMVGQWTAPFTGTVISSLSGRQAIQLLCRDERKRFVTRKPSS
jgi:phytoene dehydrogenase-like protein